MAYWNETTQRFFSTAPAELPSDWDDFERVPDDFVPPPIEGVDWSRWRLASTDAYMPVLAAFMGVDSTLGTLLHSMVIQLPSGLAEFVVRWNGALAFIDPLPLQGSFEALQTVMAQFGVPLSIGIDGVMQGVDDE